MNRRSYSVFEDNLTFLSFENRFGGKKKTLKAFLHSYSPEWNHNHILKKALGHNLNKEIDLDDIESSP